jgi:hypothetical protein
MSEYLPKRVVRFSPHSTDFTYQEWVEVEHIVNGQRGPGKQISGQVNHRIRWDWRVIISLPVLR